MTDPNKPPPPIDRKKLVGATPLTGIVCMVNYEKAKRAWLGVICQGFRYADGTEGLVVYDCERGPSKKAVSAWGKRAIAEKPWEKTDGIVGAPLH